MNVTAYPRKLWVLKHNANRDNCVRPLLATCYWCFRIFRSDFCSRRMRVMWVAVAAGRRVGHDDGFLVQCVAAGLAHALAL